MHPKTLRTGMTHKDRMLATLRGEPTDRIKKVGDCVEQFGPVSPGT